MKFLRRLFLLAIVVFTLVMAFFYWGTYENGVMAGKVLRISQKGLIFKTYEGKLSLESFGALKGVSPVAETFDFSVESSEDDVIKTLTEVALSGERVNLHFKKRYMRFPWRGDTKYFITEVERLK
ncbi:MAG: 6-phosphogluconate dehydrogenase [Bacteroidota bacterium]